MSDHQTTNSLVTCIKGLIGTSIHIVGLVNNIDPRFAPIQTAIGLIVPTLTIVSLIYDVRKKRRIERQFDREDSIKEQRRIHFIRIRRLKNLRKSKLLRYQI
jgi:hypothetical protein